MLENSCVPYSFMEILIKLFEYLIFTGKKEILILEGSTICCVLGNVFI